MKRLLLTIILLSAAAPSLADSIPFAYQNSGFSSVSLAGSPTLAPTFGARLGNAHLEFGAAVGPMSNAAVSFTLTIGGQTQTDAFTYSCASSCTLVEGFAISNHLYRDTPGTLTMTIDGRSVAESFTEMAVVPEPGTAWLAATGLIFIVRRRLS